MVYSTSKDEMWPLDVTVEPECQLMSGALQPYVFRSARGTLFVQGHGPYPIDYPLPPKNIFPGMPRTAVSRDGGHTWALWRPASGQGQGPVIEGAVVQLDESTVRVFEWIADGPSAEGDFYGRMWDTRDEWETVQGPTPFRVHLPQAATGYDDGGRPYSAVTFHRTVLQLPHGDLLAAIYCWFKGDTTPSGYEPNMNRFRCALLRLPISARTGATSPPSPPIPRSARRALTSP